MYVSLWVVWVCICVFGCINSAVLSDHKCTWWRSQSCTWIVNPSTCVYTVVTESLQWTGVGSCGSFSFICTWSTQARIYILTILPGNWMDQRWGRVQCQGRDQCQGEGPMSGGGTNVRGREHCQRNTLSLLCCPIVFCHCNIYIGSPSVLYARSTHTLIM